MLDSPVTPSQDNVKPGLDQLKGFDASIQSWYADCRSKPSCPLNPDPKLRVQQARASLKATPIDVEIEGKKRRFELSDLDSALFEIQYGPFAYDPANEAIAALSGTDTARKTLAVSFLLNLADELDMKQDDGTYGNAQEANFVVVCADSAAPSTEAEVQTIINEIAGLDPIISDDAQDITADCQFLPTGGNKGAISRSSAADHVLITASRGDPATPYAWAQELADALGVNSYTTYDGPGHANLLDNSCLLDAAVGFFVSLHSAPAHCPKVPGTTSFGRFMATQFAKEDSDTDTVNDAYVNCLAPGLESLDQLALAAPVTDSMSSSIEDEITALVINCSSGR